MFGDQESGVFTVLRCFNSSAGYKVRVKSACGFGVDLAVSGCLSNRELQVLRLAASSRDLLVLSFKSQVITSVSEGYF